METFHSSSSSNPSSPSGLYSTDAKLSFFLPPHFLGSFTDASVQYLSSFLFKYVVPLSGVLISFDKVHIENSPGVLFKKFSEIRFNLLFRAILFQPQINSHYFAKVHNQTQDHISLLLYGVFNVSIGSKQIPESLYSYSQDDEAYLIKKSKILVKHGEILEFQCIKLHFDGPHLSLQGTLDFSEPNAVVQSMVTDSDSDQED